MIKVSLADEDEEEMEDRENEDDETSNDAMEDDVEGNDEKMNQIEPLQLETENNVNDDDIEDSFIEGVVENIHDLSVDYCQQTVEDVLSKCRTLIKVIKKGAILTAFAEENRWNPTYYILETLNIYHEILHALFSSKYKFDITKKQREKLADCELNSDCWVTIESLLVILKPFDMGTKLISGST
ncbi:unnamed protein product [Didymodactylos carnosus]|uniref:Uncharacterized protein n=1 Tax=Didymodactylos carnosus TaxID=1234261 RepID=A0A814TLJ1_9BILA|nr:unnamed protein product [Didymodactylos carnosus]CAF1494255.1 unnamed protein product [Didymodactylos carnosus]CAF3925016.1 unnamed protein product [Didymodactylos carnosus]CAF4283405.1 unnamed protein product [Didymodactylos carnosus]